MSIDNPFFHRGAIRRSDAFHNREKEVRQILGLLRNGQSVSLIGPRRIGKSSLLLHLMRESVRSSYQLAAPQALFLLIDCQELGGSGAEEVYEALLSGLLETADNAGINAGNYPQAGSYHALDRTLNHIYQLDVPIVIMLDEFELLAVNEHLTPHFFARLRGLTTKYGLAFLTASQRPLFDITADEQILSSPFFNIFVTLLLDMFNPEEATSLITTRLQDTLIHFDPPLIDHLLFLVGPHPFFLHVASYHAFEALAANQPLDSTTQLDEAVEIEAESHLSYLWQNLNPEDQYALAIADGPIDSLRLLEQQCLLRQQAGRYHYTSEILHRFVRRQNVPGLIQAGPFVIDKQRHQVWANGQELSVTTSQFDLLSCLCAQEGQVVPGEQLETVVWGEALLDDPDRLKTMIKRLRRAIDPYGNWIVSERGVGYALRPPA